MSTIDDWSKPISTGLKSLLDTNSQNKSASESGTPAEFAPSSSGPGDIGQTEAEYHRALAEIEHLRAENATLHLKITTLKEEKQFFCDNGKKLGAISLKDRKEAELLRAKNEKLQQEKELLLTTLKGNKALFDQFKAVTFHSNGLQAAVNDLNADHDLLQPLVAVGAATRLRFLEKGKEHAPADMAKHMKHFPGVVMDGNRVGHCGHLIADAALFKAKMLDESYRESLSDIFKRLYRADPDAQVNNAPELCIRVKNLLATLTANYPCPTPDTDDDLQRLWTGFWDTYNAFAQKFADYNARANPPTGIFFDNMEEARNLVGAIEGIGCQIIETERVKAAPRPELRECSGLSQPSGEEALASEQSSTTPIDAEMKDTSVVVRAEDVLRT